MYRSSAMPVVAAAFAVWLGAFTIAGCTGGDLGSATDLVSNLTGESLTDLLTNDDTPDTGDDDAGDLASSEVDTDGDGFSDDEETFGVPGTDPNNAADTPLNPIDSDGDGCSDFDETNFAGFCDNDANTGSSDSSGADGDDGADTPVDPDQAFDFLLSVARHTDTTVSEDQVDAIFLTGGALLQTDDEECPDIATNTTFTRNGSITTFDAGGSTLTAESQLDDVFDVDANVKIVDLMTGVCGVAQLDDMAAVLGCAFEGGTLVVVLDAAPDVWVHEWGHVQGLLHRDNCGRNIMHSFDINTNAVNATERLAFLTPTPSFSRPRLAPFIAEAGSVQPLARAADESRSAWLHRVADRNYLSGVPSAAARTVQPGAASDLTEMLIAPQFDGRHRNIARLLGFTQNADACALLMAQPSAPLGNLNYDQLATIAESMLALGRLAEHDVTGEVVNWLIDGCDPSTWQQRGVTWRYRATAGPAVDDLLARLSILALGLSGRDDALIHLLSLRASGPPDGAIETVRAAQIDEAISRLRGEWPRTDPATARTLMR